MIDMYFYETDVLTPTQFNQIETKLEEAKSNLITMGFNIPTYQKTTWSLQSYLLAKYIINIENALKEIADIKGTNIETREWNIDGKDSFSYKDLNRWIKAYNLAYEETGQYYLASFTNFTTIENIKSKKLINLQLYGNTTQNETPTPSTPVPINVVTGRQEIEVAGKNLFNKDGGFRLGYINTSGTFVSQNLTACFNQRIPVKPSTTYTISFSKTISQMGCPIYFDKNNIFISRENVVSNETQRTITTPANCYYMVIQFNYDNSSTMTQEIIDSVNCQVEYGNTASEYETYKGKTYEINLGKNLVNMVETNKGVSGSTGAITSPNVNYLGVEDYIPVLPNTTYTITFEHNILNANLYIGNKQQDGTFIERINNGTSRTFTTGNNVYYIFPYLYKSGVTFETIGGYIQLEKNPFATSYSAYKTPIELCKIDTYQDRIYKHTDGKWYLYKEIEKILLNGTEDWKTISSGNLFYITGTGIKLVNSISRMLPMFSDRYVNNTYQNLYDASADYGVASHTSDRLCIRNKDVSGIPNFKTWLSNNNTIVYYPLATPTTTEITDTELINQLENIETLKPLMNMIYSTSNLQPSAITFEYFK